jgi:hypothetical protein
VRRFLAAVFLTGLLGFSAAPAGAGDPPAARIDPNFPPFRSVMPGAGGGAQPAPNYIVPAQRPQYYCDPYGRCWQQMPNHRGQDQERGQRPDWGYNRPRPHRDPYGFNSSE